MHIPDGYLSPSTCAVLYGASAPFWYAAGRRVQKFLHTRLIPLISLFGAFAFVLMMFNMPLPGGTTGHAAGIGISTVVLGPFGAILALSSALVIQALLFGDGGITAIGANCFNMAIAGPLAAQAVYRMVARRSPLEGRRRVFAAGLAGYAGINVAALMAAIEFGIQPLLFVDSTGAPLYAPYPLSISVPAMMLGHLAVIGFAELFLTAGLVAWLQKSDASLLARNAGVVSAESGERYGSGNSVRALWVALATLMVLTPLGILAVGTAWGEWRPEDLASVPKGLQGLSAIWTAPIPNYAPAFLKSPSFGYVLSAMVGAGTLILGFNLIRWLGRLARSS